MNPIEQRLAQWRALLFKPEPPAPVVGSRDRSLRGKARRKARRAQS